MTHDWIDEGLRHERERAEQQRLAAEHRQHQTSVINEKGQALMRDLLAEIRAVIDEYRRKALMGGDEIEFQELPQEGFRVTRTARPRVDLQCRPDYSSHALYCNMTRTNDEQPNEAVEHVFNLHFTLDDADNLELRDGTRVFRTVNEAVEFLIKPVLFPPVD